jgi:intracellular sulfur oxidation DsrE/DsrF family protein
MKRILPLVAVFLALSGAAYAGPEDFAAGPLIAEFGRVAPVPGAGALPAEAAFHVAFDVVDAGEAGAANPRLETAARFLNMHAAAGVPAERLSVAIVVHGPAAHELTRAADGESNANAALIAALIAHGVRIYLCGQTAAHYDIETSDLLPGVQMSLSAMTAHALLQQEGYTLNPF